MVLTFLKFSGGVTMKSGQESLGSLKNLRVKEENPWKVNLQTVSVPPNLLERNSFQKMSWTWWYMWLLVISSTMITYFLVIRTCLSSLSVFFFFFFEALQGQAQVHQRKQPQSICAVFLTTEPSHSQHTLWVSNDRTSPSALGKLKAVLYKHRNMLQ